jgi:hypothetical protein
MSYKGGDLELRTPQAPNAGEDAAGQTGRSQLAELGRDGPIAVDQTVLACCNAAYDAAVFHGSRDVRVEHLLYALTRVDAAREILEQHGLRTHQLRCDAAAAMVAEAPAAGGGRAPRSSAELENVLRRAAGRAGRDGVPASVHDLMRAILGYGREAPATALFLRSASDPQQLERWAAEAPVRYGHHGAGALQPAMARELLGRLEAMETAFASLAAEVAADRRAMLDLMGDIQRELRSVREENQAAQPAIVLDKIEDVGKSVSGLTERFEAIRAIGPGEAFAGRLAALESKLSEQPSAVADAIAYMLGERRDGQGAPLQLTSEDGRAGSNAVADKLAELEATVRVQSERMDDAGKTHERDLNEIFEALVKLGANQQTLASNLEAWRLDSGGDVSIVSNRLANLERTLMETLSPADGEEDHHRNGARVRSFKRWLYGTSRVLPATWRQDAAALREAFRSTRRIGKS